jgi:phosphoribosylamine--glycine ligase
MDRIVRPTVAEMARRGTPYHRGALCRADDRGRRAALVEYNVRFGDPECQVLMMRLGGAGARPDAGLRRGAAAEMR